MGRKTRSLVMISATDHGRKVMAMEDPTERHGDDVFFDGHDENGTDYHCRRCARILARRIKFGVEYAPLALECPACQTLSEWPYVYIH